MDIMKWVSEIPFTSKASEMNSLRKYKCNNMKYSVHGSKNRNDRKVQTHLVAHFRIVSKIRYKLTLNFTIVNTTTGRQIPCQRRCPGAA